MHAEDFLFVIVMQFFPVTSNVTAIMSYWKPKEKFSISVLVTIKLVSQIWFRLFIGFMYTMIIR
jgi:hypothetical protein